MHVSDLPDFDDKFIGEAILAIMFFFLFVWLTSSASPIAFGQKAQVGNLVAHLEVMLVAVIPIALLGLIQSMRSNPRELVQTRSAAFGQRLAVRARTYRQAHAGARKRYLKPSAKSETVKRE